ncbi:multicopper oxidase domain-containing protein [Desulfuromonas versatilis]|nr:multicopper oxidase domain-containing protein [Desulfuromonas versatilis]
MAALLVFTMIGAAQAALVEYSLHAARVEATMPSGEVVPMWGFGIDGAPASFVPPVLTATAGDTLTIHLTNHLTAEPVSVVINGQRAASMVPTWTDGNSALTRAANDFTTRVRSFTHETGAAAAGPPPVPTGPVDYTWTDLKPGTYLVQSGTHQSVQVPMGLYAVLKVHAAAGLAYPGVPFTNEASLLFSEIDPALNFAVDGGTYGTAAYMTSVSVGYNPKYFLINGAPYSVGAPLNIGAGIATEKILLRFLNAGLRGRMPVVQDGYFKLIAQDGNPGASIPEQYSLDLTPGKTVDAELLLERQGSYKIYDRAMGLTNSGLSSGGMLVNLNVAQNMLSVVSPNGGETLTGGTIHNVQWTPRAGAANYLLRYSTNGGTTWLPIASVAGTSFDWTVPSADSANSLVRVTAYDAGGAWLGNDVSDGPFTITPGTPPSVLAVVSPNGGETLVGGTSFNVEWSAHAGAANYLLRYSTNGGVNWLTIASVTGTSFNWTVPSADSANCLVRVTAYGAGGSWLANDVSNAPFTITPGTPPSVLAVVSPNGGETLAGGSSFNIEWDAQAGAASYLVRYSTNGGASWLPIASTAGTNFNWTVPSADSANCLLRVTAYAAGGAWLANDVSNAPFTMTP